MFGKINFKKIDTNLLTLFFILVIFGIINIFSTTYNASESNFSFSKSYIKQSTFFFISLIIGIFILQIRKEKIYNFSSIFYIISSSLLILVLLIGVEKNGAKAWFGVGAFGIQPAEFSKLATSMFLSQILTNSGLKQSKFQTLLIISILLLFPITLILLQPDLGTVLVFTSFLLVLYRFGYIGNILIYSFSIMFFAIISLIYSRSSTIVPIFGKVQTQYLIIFIIFILTLLMYFLIYNFILKRDRRKTLIILISFSILCMAIVPTSINFFNKIPSTNYQKNRIEKILGLEDYSRGVGYNTDQSVSAIASGGIAGKGFMNHTLANEKYNQVPEQTTDFIFCSIAEQFGFLGSTIYLGLFLFLLIRMIILAERQSIMYSKVFIYSISCIFFLHFMINIGMVLGVVPIIGIPLPFASYGGSSLLAFSLMIILVLKFDMDR